MNQGLSALDGSRWRGDAELWLDADTDEATMSVCTLSVQGSRVSYTWRYEGEPQTGSLTVREGSVGFEDSFHSATEMACAPREGSWALMDVTGTYGPPEGPLWGWRLVLAMRPSGELVLLMDNIGPWGEEMRAVRMVLKRQKA
ncbi:MAG: hypothetical protein Q8Q09_16890 [Deltaproteobacteria bacterium]|nr:hypothetical protein [Deltaproteobacteria bacterium]